MSLLALIGLGSNLGDRRAILDGAVATLVELPGVTIRAVSSYHETRPIGGPAGQGAFLNAAATIETTLEPAPLLAALHEVERRAGRVREEHWGARTLDLDLLLCGDRIIHHPGIAIRRPDQLQVPHPLFPFRRFVLAPAAEVAPELIDPITHRPVADLLANLDRRPSSLATCWGSPGDPRRTRVFRGLIDGLPASGISLDAEVGWRPDQVKGAEAAVEGLANDLRSGRWTRELWGDRWIVTDFWLDFSFPIPLSPGRGRGLPRRHERIQPMFVVMPGPISNEFLDGIRFRVASGKSPMEGIDVPIFVPDASDAEGVVSEVMAICAATRSD